MTDYYMSTRGSKPFFYKLEGGLKPEYNISLMYDIKKVNRFSYFVFRYLGINLESSKADRYKWFKTMARFNKEILLKNKYIKIMVDFFSRFRGIV